VNIIHHAPPSHEDRRKSVIEVNLRLSAGVQCSKEKSFIRLFAMVQTIN
jgi:hypothetical protein